jgi:putative oxidoreductase
MFINYKGNPMSTSLRVYQSFQHISNAIGDALPPLVLRLILAWEFGEAGYEKLTGSNWFGDVTFIFPFNLLPPDVSWQMATCFELGGALLLILGLATRFVSLSLIILTIVAIAAVHWPTEWHSLSQLLTGYRIIDTDGDGFGNYKLPLLYIVMFLPLLFRGAGTLSLDHLLSRRLFK